MADQSLLAEVQRELTEIRKQAKRLAGQVRAVETVVEWYGQGEGENC